MIEGHLPVTQALLGTLLTWGLTAAGSAMVIFLRGNQVIYFCFISVFFMNQVILSIICINGVYLCGLQTRIFKKLFSYHF